ncbi:WD40 [Musa troglodytarum]|uniref:WD40 n=1 Tax=Musa troglodytarum TaxID=320322 RepID=A0A9E7GX96_9LILI|nr:WD40 [Musa troglodytarum]
MKRELGANGTSVSRLLSPRRPPEPSPTPSAPSSSTPPTASSPQAASLERSGCTASAACCRKSAVRAPPSPTTRLPVGCVSARRPSSAACGGGPTRAAASLVPATTTAWSPSTTWSGASPCSSVTSMPGAASGAWTTPLTGPLALRGPTTAPCSYGTRGAPTADVRRSHAPTERSAAWNSTPGAGRGSGWGAPTGTHTCSICGRSLQGQWRRSAGMGGR